MQKHKKIEPNEFYEITEQEYEILRHFCNFLYKIHPLILTEDNREKLPDSCFPCNLMLETYHKAMDAYSLILKEILAYMDHDDLIPLLENLVDEIDYPCITFAENPSTDGPFYHISFSCIDD